MVNRSEKTSSQAQSLPELIRVLLKKLEVNRHPISSSSKQLDSKITRELSLELLKPTEKKLPVRIKGVVTVTGNWCDVENGALVVSYLGKYEARFVCPPSIAYEEVDAWMEIEFFRDAVIAQAIPVINVHMYSQLEMMGINPKVKTIGYGKLLEEWKVPPAKRLASPSKRLPSKASTSVRKKTRTEE